MMMIQSSVNGSIGNHAEETQFNLFAHVVLIIWCVLLGYGMLTLGKRLFKKDEEKKDKTKDEDKKNDTTKDDKDDDEYK